jgi:signal transduction histidine kinase
MPRVCGRLRCALLAALLTLVAASSEAAPVRHVLLLQSFHRGNFTVDSFTGDFRVELDRLAGSPVNVVQVVVGPTGFVVAPEQATVDYIRATFANRPTPDLIVTVAGPAAAFARKYRQQLFPDTPILFASVDHRYLRDSPLADNEAAVAVDNDFARLVDDILQVLPRTRQLFVVMGSGIMARFWRPELEKEFARFHGRLTFAWSDNLSLAETLDRGARLPADSAIFYLTFGTDAAGAAYADERVIAGLHATANAPLFSPHSPFFGSGTVGGSMMAIDELSRQTADAAIRILNGAPPASIRVPLQTPGQRFFDWRELQRWDVPESRLPAGSVVRFRGPTLWGEYRRQVLIALGLVVIQLCLIAGLLYQRRARRRAELESRRNLALAADANRRQTMSALTSSIGHELSQPLTSLLHNAQALQLLVKADRATPDTIGEILSEIHTESLRATQIIGRHRTMLRSHTVDRRPIDIHEVITESLALISHDMTVRRVVADTSVPAAPCVVNGDQVLLQQVLVNLVMNAMDAMAELPPIRRRLTITSEVAGGDVAVSVRDRGTGLPMPINDTLFAPFVTTKPNGVGIGLTIVRTIVDTHGGAITAHNNPEGGATFTIRLPLAGTASALDQSLRFA